MSECVIPDCVRTTLDDYCEKHQLAFDNIETAFAEWQRAYGSKFTKKQYLERLLQDETINAGIWVKEIAQYLLDKK